jgi:Radical SAM superfamily/Iron-sulfur cluster-binding domain
MGLIKRMRSLFGRTRPLSFVQIELTNYCSCYCLNCPQSQWRAAELSGKQPGRQRGYMDYELFKKIVDEADNVARALNFSFFGEPTLHPQFLRFMEYLKGRSPQLSVSVNTNLTTVTREMFDELVGMKLSNLRISIDAASRETYDLLRPGDDWVGLDGEPKPGEGRFETICGKAEYWLSRPDHRPTRHVFTVSSRNLDELRPYVERWLPLLGSKDVILSKSVLTYGGKMRDPLIMKHPCNVWSSGGLTVDWQGRVSPCNLDTGMAMVIGSVQGSTLLELFDGANMREWAGLSRSGRVSPCRECIDANNWSKNFTFRKGDTWSDECRSLYSDLLPDGARGG